MLPINPRSSFENLPTPLVDSIFSFLEEEVEETMPSVCSIFFRRKIVLGCPKKFISLLEQYGKPFHRLPLLGEKTAQTSWYDNLKELPDSLMRLSCKEEWVAVALRIQVQATHLFHEELERLKKRAPTFFEFHIKNQIPKGSHHCEFPPSQGGLIVYCQKNNPTPTWRYKQICPKDNFIIRKLITREKIKAEDCDVGLHCPLEAFKTEEKFYSFLEGLLKGDDSDFKLI